VWVIACWGAGLILHALGVFWRRPITEAEINAEVHRRQEKVDQQVRTQDRIDR
jgi:hypothetical protein